MQIFISWSGEASKAVAEELRDWLPLVLHYVEPWMSDIDIDAGDRWADSVASELESSNFGIICVTKENASSPWILFEAGALAKSMKGSKVIPLLFDLDFREISGPLAQFQAKKLEKSGVGEVIQSINLAADTPDDSNRAEQLFEALWPKFETVINAIPTNAEPMRPTRPEGEILEELVASVRTLDNRIRDTSEAARSPAGVGGPEHMSVHSELALKAIEGTGDPLCLLAVAAAFKDSVPWLFELGVDAYRSVVVESDRSDQAVRRFLSGVEIVRGSPLPWVQFGVEPQVMNTLLGAFSSPPVAASVDGGPGASGSSGD